MTKSEAWQNLILHTRTQKRRRIADLFEEDTGRVDAMSLDVGGLHFDFSKTHAGSETLDALSALYKERGFKKWRKAMFEGDAINESEGRPVLHSALRDKDAPKAAASFVAKELKKMRAFVEAAHEDGQFTDVLHLGIGGSALGPQMVVDALKDGVGEKMAVHVVSNVDGAALAPLLKRLDARRTLVVVASKTFTTIETMTNANSVLAWLKASGVENPMTQVVAATANPKAAQDFGVAADKIFAFADWVGGRYSLWSSVGLPIALGLGWKAFESLLKGAADMDAHFRNTKWPHNAPMLAAALDVWYASFWQAQTRAVFAYDNRLHLLVPYLQQLEMESNGKAVTRSGGVVRYATSPVTWGGVGTDCQHAVFQLLHQGTHLIPAEFIAVLKPDHDLKGHHRLLLANCFAQSAALMQGRSKAEVKKMGVSDDSIAAAKTFKGNRPSVTILMDKLKPRALGALLAFYEHRTFAAGCLWNINSFDQMGVELGKELAKGLGAVLDGDTKAMQLDPSTKALLAKLG